MGCCKCADVDGPLSGRLKCVCIWMLIFSLLTLDPFGVILACIVICRCCGLGKRKRCVASLAAIFLALTVIALALIITWGVLFVTAGKDCRDSISCRYTTDGAGCDGLPGASTPCCADGKFVNEDSFLSQPDCEKTCIPKLRPPKARQLAAAFPLLDEAVPALERVAGELPLPLLQKVTTVMIPRAFFPLTSRLLYGPREAAATDGLGSPAAASPERGRKLDYWKDRAGVCVYCDEAGSGDEACDTPLGGDKWCCNRDLLGDGVCNPECSACDADGGDCPSGDFDRLPTCCAFDLGDQLGKHCHSTTGDWDWICDMMDSIGYIVLGTGLAIILIQCVFYIVVLRLACKLDQDHGSPGGYGTRAYAVDTGFGLARA